MRDGWYAPPRYCVFCRGEHDEANHQRNHRPYTVAKRFEGLGLAENRFTRALLDGELPVRLDVETEQPDWTVRVEGGGAAGRRAHKTLAPKTMSVLHYEEWLPLFLEGVREQHEPFRLLAFKAALEMIEHGDGKVTAVLDRLVRPLRAGLNTFQPAIVAHVLYLLCKMLARERAHGFGLALAPHLKRLIPPINLLRTSGVGVFVPSPRCLPMSGSMTGRGPPPRTAANLKCLHCGVRVEQAKPAGRGPPGGTAGPKGPPVRSSQPPDRLSRRGERRAKKFVLSELVADVLELAVREGGQDAYRAVKDYIPTYDGLL